MLCILSENRAPSLTRDHIHGDEWISWKAALTDIEPDRHRSGARASNQLKGSANYLYADGIPNLIEYALGGNPLAPGDQAKLPTVGTTQVSGQNRLTLSFTPANTDGLQFIIQASTDLTDWSDQTDITALLTRNQLFTFIDSANLATTPRRFLRLRVLVP